MPCIYTHARIYMSGKIQRTFKASISGLPPQCPCHFSLQPSARVSKTLQPSYLSHMTAAATSADQYGTSTALITETH